MPRLLAIGDIHGCSAALRALLDAAELSDGDRIVTLGDYVDRGPDSCGVIETLLALEAAGRLIPLLGNHEEMLLGALRGTYSLAAWLQHGGVATLKSYNAKRLDDVPAEHVAFLDRCLPYYESEEAIFTHANYVADEPLNRQPADALRWQSLHEHFPERHASGKRAFVGHTAQPDGDLLDAGHLVCLDTACCRSGLLTMYDVRTNESWQADITGQLAPL
ncbi:Serine/threonine-protein phosphatase 1 [Planctomycetes bacterium MalM25]|nr:Serine/threonine-protein phosphatase 1 [Planctomycetes bacterium MalM25]